MNKISKESIVGVDIYDYLGKNYMAVMSYDKWRVAYLNHGDRVEEKSFHRIERNMQTDEVFVLLERKATLIIGLELNKIEMIPHKVYNVPKGVWHHIITKEETRVLVIENEDTCDKNSEYMSID